MHADDPCPLPASCIEIHSNARFTVLTDRLLRLEWAENGAFEDRATLAVRNRLLPAVPHVWANGLKAMILRTASLDLRYRPDGRPFHRGNLEVRHHTAGRAGLIPPILHVRKNLGIDARWRPGQRDRRNLGGTCRTLDEVFGGDCELGPGLLSRSGFAVVDDSGTPVIGQDGWVAPRSPGHRLDLYLLACGRDYKAALRDASLVFGKQPLPPRFAFGLWWSRYWAATDREIEELVDGFDRRAIPLDVMVIDMDWHLEGWTGYTWDRRFFPDPDEHLARLHAKGLKVTLNLHPAEGVGRHEEAFAAVARDLGLDAAKIERVPFDCTDRRFMEAYFRRLHHPLEDRGVDFWWMDWQQGSETRVKGLDPLPWLNVLHWRDQEKRRPRRRPLNFTRWGGLGSGRMPVGFSGDTYSTWESLAFQPAFTATAANALFGCWSHDIGGHYPGPIAPELFLRWVQFGAHSPVLRTHVTKNEKAERRPWAYPEPHAGWIADAVRRRYELVPYLYTECRIAMDEGLSLCRPLYHDWPDEEEAYRASGQYAFGSRMIAAPVTRPADPADDLAPVRAWLPPGEWVDTALGDVLEGGRSVERRYAQPEVPVFVRPGTVIPGQRDALRLAPGSYPNLTITAWPGGAGEYRLFEDDGWSTDYLSGRCAWIPLRRSVKGKTVRIETGAAEGSFEGFRAIRPLEVRLPMTAPPRRVSAAGKALPWALRLGDRGWTWDGTSAETVVRLPVANLRFGVRVEIETDPSLPADAASGWKGLMARLESVRALVTIGACAPRTQTLGREAVEAAQAGNRASRDPSSFPAEVERLRGLLRALPEVIRRMRRKALQLDRMQALEKAGRVLEAARAEFPKFFRDSR